MSKEELLAKADEAIAACLEQTKARADKQEPMGARNMARAASTLVALRWRIATDDWKGAEEE